MRRRREETYKNKKWKKEKKNKTLITDLRLSDIL